MKKMYNTFLKLEFSEIKCKRVELIPVSMDYLSDMHEYSIIPEFFKFLEYEEFTSIEETRNYLEDLIKISQNGNGHYWFIRLLKENKIVGTFDIINVDQKRNSCEIGYGISPKFWNIGLFSEVLEHVIPELFERYHFRRIFVKTHVDNLSSIRGLEKNGFVKEGIMRDYYLTTDKKRYDACLLSIIDDSTT
jgi:ribosomal-protein-alanine N-acetyltransferase|tara:strand:+ start:730 stop:1302 length:573 start_codon:yes stop_codon:yes gene_type:complete